MIIYLKYDWDNYYLYFVYMVRILRFNDKGVIIKNVFFICFGRGDGYIKR